MITSDSEKLAAVLRWFHQLQKARVALNGEIEKARQEILFFESMEENGLCQK